MNVDELKLTIKDYTKAGINTLALSTDFHMKFSIPATTIVFCLLAIPLSIQSIRAGKSWGFVISVIIVFSFYVFASVFRSLGRGGVIDPLMAAWIPPVSVSLLGISMILKEGRH